MIEIIGALDQFGELAPMAFQAAVGVEAELIAVDRVRDYRRLLRIIPCDPNVVDDWIGERRRRGGFHGLSRPG